MSGESPPRPDFEAEGLLEDLEGEARAARLHLLEALHDAGIGIDALREAVATDRLAILPAEHELSGRPRFTTREVCARAGVPLEYFEAMRRACGLAHVDPDDLTYDDEDLEGARVIAQFYESGLDRDGMLAVGRVLGRGLSQAADAMGELFGQTFIKAGVAEDELGLRNAQAAREMLPAVTPLLGYLLRRHVRERLRHQAVTRAMLENRQLRGAEDVAVAFADMVAFTRLGESLAAEEVGGIAGRLEQLASECATLPVRLVKTIGDAAMLVSREPEALLTATLDLVDAAEQMEDFPRLRAGAAYGPALPRSGDWYGRPVNIASRLADVADAGAVVGTKELCDAAGDVCDWGSLGGKKLKGVEGEVEVFRADRR